MNSHSLTTEEKLSGKDMCLWHIVKSILPFFPTCYAVEMKHLSHWAHGPAKQHT